MMIEQEPFTIKESVSIILIVRFVRIIIKLARNLLQISPSWLFSVIFAGIYLAGCSSNTVSFQPAPLSRLSPYQTRTPYLVPTLTPPVTETPQPTSTPIIYQVAINDTLSAIARQFGVDLNALLAANPGVIPEALVVGQTLTIPSGESDDAFELLITPVPLEPGPAFCRPSGIGTICLVSVYNPYPQAVENVKLLVTLIDEQGQPLAREEAVLPLNILPQGSVLPAAVFFNIQAPRSLAQVRLLTAMRIEAGESRYLQTAIQNLLVGISWDGLSANLQGRILLPETEKPAARLWLVAFAFDAGDQIIGFRRWEWSGVLQPGDSQAFMLSVYSLGSVIDHVDVLVEARP